MKRIVYLLHRFPAITDTFIKREIRSLQKAGTDVQIISVWKPRPTETTPAFLKEWSGEVEFLLPRSLLSVLQTLFWVVVASPAQFAEALRLALVTAQPGIRGCVYQMIYFAEAMLAAGSLRKRRIDHVHNHFGDHSGLVTMLACKLSGIAYSISFHGPHVFFDGKNATLKEKVDNALFIRCISYFCRSQVIVYSGSSNLAALKIVHCGLDLSKYQFRPPREQVRQIFCAARLAPEKGIEFLVDALMLLIAKHYDVYLRLAGDGPSRATLEEKARKLGVAGHVSFLGNVSEDDVTHELGSSDLFVLPSLAEGIPVSVMEAMAVGVPVVATNIAGTSELVENGKTGILVRPSDPQALADAVVKMMGDYDFRRRAAQLGRAKIENEFDIDKESAKLNSYFLQ